MEKITGVAALKGSGKWDEFKGRETRTFEKIKAH